MCVPLQLCFQTGGFVGVLQLGRDEIASGKDVVWIQLPLGCLVQLHTDIGDALRVPARSYLAHTVMVRDGTTGGEDFIARLVFDFLVNGDGVREAGMVKAEVKVHARASIVRLRYPAGDEVVLDVMFGTFLQRTRGWRRVNNGDAWLLTR